MTEQAPTQFLYHALRDFGVYKGPPSSDLVPGIKREGLEVKIMKYSPDGRYLAWSTSTSISILSASDYKIISEIHEKNVVEISFSPKGNYMMTYERFIKSTEDAQHRNLKVFKTDTGELLGSFTQKSSVSWQLQWPEDESFCAQLVTNNVHFFKPTASMGTTSPDMKLNIEGIKSFSISPGLSPLVAAFIPERKGKPAAIRLYKLGIFNQPISNKSFYKAEKVEFMWHSLGTSLLALTHTDVDNTGKSYYGETNLYYMSIVGNFDCRVPLNKEGPIHDVVWNPIEKEFVVIYGYMPAKISLFDNKANEIFCFGIEPRNMVKFNPQGRVLAIAGFGNLSGHVDLWDYKKRKLVKSINAHGSTICNWSPCGRYLLAATLSPRLRVDNGFKIWHYSGNLVHSRAINELYDVQWRPSDVSNYPQRGKLDPLPQDISIYIENVGNKAPPTSTKPVGAYRPPHARNGPSSGPTAPVSLSQRAGEDTTGGSKAYTPPTQTRYIPGAPPPKAKPTRSPKPAKQQAENGQQKGGNPDKNSKKDQQNKENSQKSNNQGQKDRGNNDEGKLSVKNSKPHTQSSNSSPQQGGNQKFGSPVPGKENESPEGNKSPSQSNPAVKRFLVLQRKLRQIDTLMKKRDSGEVLNEAQQNKIASRSLVIKQMEECNPTKQ
ncbi:Eukaryotic translation initiation factor 2A [Smittium culicis]|uniref:Eukaryotic translation initiation factor 2A n=1 Tax=Smittium culicis TaxID=133412 RepID=A0A1R1XUC9_9FUNG|nr:Eukaryotic translation initiation factor 2A [Smittium culicis]OMJ24408.1 Eukaryotic translation initiation factor 2A [Smittium culicis]